MKVSYNWLKDYCNSNLDPELLGERFLLTSSELESLTDWSDRLRGLVVGVVQSVRPHPNADRLRIATVSLGHSTRSIVCGAPNLAPHQKVVVALPGTTLYPVKGDVFTLQAAIIRGEHSEGMLCAAEEIGIALPSDGILVLPPESEVGAPVAQALKLDDAVLDLEITPNRPDLLSYIGLAREMATFDKKPLQSPPIYTFQEHEEQLDSLLDVRIENSQQCYRYSAICLDNIQIHESPLWLQLRLLLSGIKPVNNVVDVTNYVMLEMGQPLHAFDYHSLHDREITVRNAHKHEQLAVLDNSVRQLEPEDILITSHGHPIAIAGIIGGIESGISDQTQQIVLESATFHGPQIRRTSRRLGLRTEASSRFEKGTDPELTITALKRAVLLLKEICGARVSSRLLDLFPNPHPSRPRIHVSLSKVQQVTGLHISATECKSILQKLGFQLPVITKSAIEVVPPSWRRDVTLAEDVIEELIRIWGYDRIPNTLPVGPIKPPAINQTFARKQLARQCLAEAGYHETIHISLTSADTLAKLHLPAKESAICLPQPLSSETGYLLPNHLAAFMDNLAGKNLQLSELALFEIGHLFRPKTKEAELLSLLIRTNQDIELTYRRLKANITRLCNRIAVAPPTFQLTDKNSDAYYVPGSQLAIYLGEQVVGQLGLIQPEVVQNFKLRSGKTVMYAELDLELILNMPSIHHPYQPAPLYPTAERDLTLIVDQQLPSQSVIALLEKEVDPSIIRSWEIRDIYHGKPLDKTKKSVTIHFVYSATDRTLQDQEINHDQKRLTNLCLKTLAAVVH